MNKRVQNIIIKHRQQKYCTTKCGFIRKYQIKVIGDHQVSVNLRDTSRIDFLIEARALASELFDQGVVQSDVLEKWARDEAFNRSPEGVISVDGNVQGSTNMTRQQQEDECWCNVPLEDLAVAHVANFVATGTDLFDGNIVRARGGALYFNDGGLDVYYYFFSDDYSYNIVAASSAVPSPN